MNHRNYLKQLDTFGGSINNEHKVNYIFLYELTYTIAYKK